jgi:glutaredoxin 3
MRKFEDKGLKYTAIDISDDPEAKRRLAAQTGQKTVPFIFIDDKFIGGHKELGKLIESGELDELLK